MNLLKQSINYWQHVVVKGLMMLFFALLFAACENDERCTEGTVDAGVLPIGETPQVDSILRTDTILFLLNDTSTIKVVKTSATVTQRNKTTISDVNCNVSYTPEIKTVTYSALGLTPLADLRLTASKELKTKQRTLEVRLGVNVPGYNRFYPVYQYGYLNLDFPVYPLKLNVLTVDEKDYPNVGVLTTAQGSYFFFAENRELLEIRMSNGHVLSKIR